MTADCYTPPGLFRYLLGPTDSDSSCHALLNTLSAPTSVSIQHYLKIFWLTCGLELLFYFLIFLSMSFTSKATSNKPPLFQIIKKAVLSTVVCNLVSHPAVYFVFPALASALQLPYYQLLVAAELFAPISEIAVLTRLWKTPNFRTTLGVTLANLFSWWVGILVTS